MKEIARIDLDPKSRPITIWQAAKNPNRWRGHVFYPLVGDRPMHARFSKTPHFYFKAQGGNSGGSGGGGEGIVHEMSKRVIALRGGLSLTFDLEGEEVIDVAFAHVNDEVRVKERGDNYWIDLVADVVTPHNLAQAWGGQLGIEIWVTHRTEEQKKWALRRLGLAVVELKVYEKITVRDPARVSEEDLAELERRLQGYFAAPRFVWYLSDPNYVPRARKKQVLTDRVVPNQQPKRLLARPPRQKSAEPESVRPTPYPTEPSQITTVSSSPSPGPQRHRTLVQQRTEDLTANTRTEARLLSRIRRLLRRFVGLS